MNADDQSSVTAAQVRQETKEAVQTATAFATQQRNEYRAQMRQRLETIQAHVDALKAQLAQAPPDAAAEARRFFEQMEQQLATARAKADQPEATTEEAWESLRSELDAAIQGLEQSAEDVRARLTDQQEKDQELTDQQEDNQEQPASEK
jgi:hypothetical protein